MHPIPRIPVATCLLGAFLLSGSGLHARALDWGCSIYASNVQQDETTPLDDAYVFYLGVFSEGFTPTSGNIAEWAENWTTVDAVNYNPYYQVFNARHTLSPSDPAVGRKGYIWGIHRDPALNEWVLISDPTWAWPEDSLLGFKVNWMVGEASEAVIGAVNSNGHQVVTQNVGDAPLPSIDYAIWAKRFFADGDPDADAMADPDGNGRPNMLDFALDDNPVATGANNALESGIFEIVEGPEPLDNESDTRYLAVIVRPSMDANVTISGQLSTTPTFTQNVEAAVVEDLGDGTLLVRDSTPADEMTTPKFLRVEVN